MNKTRRLIGLGYLPKEFPPEFTSVSLAGSYPGIIAAAQDPHTSRPEVFNLGRSGYSRRILRITNPVHYIRQARAVGTHWADIRRIFKKSKLSESRPRFTALKGVGRERATNLGPSRPLPELRLQALASHRYVLQTDFARFFSSIYTHSIPWAIHGKPWSKANRRTPSTGNDLDAAIRNGQDQQTAGIPVSSDVAHVVSEIIASVIDANAFPRTPSGYRYVDDYFLCFDSEADAVKNLERLASAAREFEIDLNYSKTSIQHVKELLDEVGLDQLRDFQFSDARKISTKEIHKLFDVAVRLNGTQENALKYAIRVISRREVDETDWSVLESYLLRSVTLSPNTIDYVAIALYEAAQRGASLDKSRVMRYFAGVIKESLAFDRDSELIWSLWLFKNLRFSVPRSISSLLGRINSSPAAIIALDLQANGLVSGTLDTSRWVALLTADDLYDANWLLVYESIVKGWLTPPTDIIAADASFDAMRRAGVHFYEEDALTTAAPIVPPAGPASAVVPTSPPTFERPGILAEAPGAEPVVELPVRAAEDHLVPAWILNMLTRRSQALEAEFGEVDDVDVDVDDEDYEEEDDESIDYEMY
ncbi:MAG: hypothetical protein JWM87_1708 [Candidatus Eremiobacteraeota bacterium]|nr:hypothetical protein [Candidatus Eremiobacteraeota bacterium]